MSTSIPELTHYARILSPHGVYPSQSIFFEDSSYFSDSEISFSICKFEKHTRGGDEDNDSYSEVEWLNPVEAKLYGCLMLSINVEEGYCAFYPYPITESIAYGNELPHKEWLVEIVKPYLIKKIDEPDILHPGYSSPAKNYYQDLLNHIIKPPYFSGHDYDFRDHGFDYELAKIIYKNIDINDDLLVRGLTTLIKSGMLHGHYQFLESAIHSLYISMEVSFRLVLRALKAQGVAEPTSTDAMTYIHDAFNDVIRSEKYFEEYYDGRVATFHPDNRFGIFPHAPLMADDFSFLFRDMIEVYAFLICGHINTRHNEKLK